MNNLLHFPAVAIPVKWRWHYYTLQRLRAALLHKHHAGSAVLRWPHDEGRDVVDVADDLQEQDELLAEMAIGDVKLAEVDAALERIRDGSYGICEETGRPIPARRLRVLPWTRFTQHAAQLHENPNFFLR